MARIRDSLKQNVKTARQQGLGTQVALAVLGEGDVHRRPTAPS
jgi:hypothetical protein